MPKNDIKQKRIKLEIDEPRGYTLKTIDVDINDFVISKKRSYTYV